MKGYIKIETTTTSEGHDGLSVRTELEHVTAYDKLNIVHSVCLSLKIQPEELRLLASLMESGIMDSMFDIKSRKGETEYDQCQGTCEGCKQSHPANIIDEMLRLLME